MQLQWGCDFRSRVWQKDAQVEHNSAGVRLRFSPCTDEFGPSRLRLGPSKSGFSPRPLLQYSSTSKSHPLTTTQCGLCLSRSDGNLPSQGRDINVANHGSPFASRSANLAIIAVTFLGSQHFPMFPNVSQCFPMFPNSLT